MVVFAVRSRHQAPFELCPSRLASLLRIFVYADGRAVHAFDEVHDCFS